MSLFNYKILKHQKVFKKRKSLPTLAVQVLLNIQLLLTYSNQLHLNLKYCHLYI
jgi:hypothetical protein